MPLSPTPMALLRIGAVRKSATTPEVFCAPAPDDPYAITVAGIDINHANIVGYLPYELGILTDLALFHINSNHFYGKVPDIFRKLNLLYELDIVTTNSINSVGKSTTAVDLKLDALIHARIDQPRQMDAVAKSSR
ncbi:hypothetical protein GQ457_09G020080 [Hibiscus cannabinus]